MLPDPAFYFLWKTSIHARWGADDVVASFSLRYWMQSQKYDFRFQARVDARRCVPENENHIFHFIVDGFDLSVSLKFARLTVYISIFVI